MIDNENQTRTKLVQIQKHIIQWNLHRHTGTKWRAPVPDVALIVSFLKWPPCVAGHYFCSQGHLLTRRFECKVTTP